MKLLITALAGVAAAVLMVASASAHAEPRRVFPGEGAVLTAPPPQIEVVFTQDVVRRGDDSRIVLLDAQGNQVNTEESVIDDADRRRVTLAVPADLPPGIYEVAWFTLSAEDGDDASGSYRFTIDPSAEPDPGREELGEEPAAPSAEPSPAVIEPAGTPGDRRLSSTAVAGIVGAGVFVACQFGLIYWLRARGRP